MLDDYTLLKSIGKGAFGEVYLTSKSGTSQQFATKQISKKFSSNPIAKKYLDNEISILYEINHHPNIVKLYEVKETSKNLYLITEYCNGGDLSSCLKCYKEKHNKAFPENIVQYLMRQIISAIQYIHSKGILHRDIKLENILVQFDNLEDKKKLNMLKSKIKLIDFGFARHLSKGRLAHSILGTPNNMDPEILKILNKKWKKEKMEHIRDFGYDHKVDIWSLGTICYELLVGKTLFDANSMEELVSRVEKGYYHLSSNISKEFISFLNGMLQYNYNKRLSADQLSRHKFLKLNYNQLTKINQNDIKKWLDGSKILMDTKLDSILEYIGNMSQIFEENYKGGMIEEKKKEDNNMKIVVTDDDYSSDDENSNRNCRSKKFNERDLDEEFLTKFQLFNDDCIFIEPKIIPFFPGNNPAIINQLSDLEDDL